MMTVEELQALCRGIRLRNRAVGVPDGSPEVNDDLVSRIEAEVKEYRAKFLTRPVPQRPPEPLPELLSLMGWLIYEASLDRLWDVVTAFPALPDVRREASDTAAALIVRLANAARLLIWPEYAGRAIGAIRAQALVASKVDTEDGFDQAWILHNEADDRYVSFKDTLGADPDLASVRLVLDEVFLQLALAETGTACRTAERVIGRWAEDFASADPDQTRHDSEAWTQRMFLRLIEGIETGERALAVARTIHDDHGFALAVTENRMVLPTAFRNPSIMTCRAILLTYSMCPEMRRMRREPPGAFSTWSAYQKDLLKRFDAAFLPLLAPVEKADGSPWPLSPEHRRSMVQNCLHLALVTPSHPLPQEVTVDESLSLRLLDNDAVEAMSAWLATEVDGRPRGDANIIGSSSKSDFNHSVEACRVDAGAAADYHAWRCRWLRLDRYANENGRRQRMLHILGCAAN